MNRLNNYLYDHEYKIILKDNYANIINYSEIVDFSIKKISIKCKNKLINIDGNNLVISKMQDNEVVIIGNINAVSIN